MKVLKIAVIACLAVGIAGGYGIGYFIYTPQITSYAAQINGLTTEVANLNQTVSCDQEQLLALESEKARLQADLSNQQKQAAVLKTEKEVLQRDLASYQGQVTSLQSQASGSQTRLSRILGITVIQYYGWSYEGKSWQWNLSIPLSLYVRYLEKPRPGPVSAYAGMAKDAGQVAEIDQMAGQINSTALKEHFTELEKVNFVIAFVQSLPYTVDIETTPYNDYPRFPVETLFERGGDCEDTSILVAALLDRLGYDVALLHLDGARHMAAGISLNGMYGSYYEYQGKKYFYLETTGKGWRIGQIPPTITSTQAIVYPLRS